MAPKNSQEEEDIAVTALRASELRIGHVLTRKSITTSIPSSVPSSLRAKDLKNWNGSDIVRKGGRKTRYVFLLPASLTLTQAGGKVGTLAQMDTETPVLYLEFPQGRMKCQGRIVRPEVRLLPLAFEGKQNVTCKDIVNTLVVFSEIMWVGTAEENPEEKHWPMPASLNFQIEGPTAEEVYVKGGKGGEKGGKDKEGEEEDEEEGGGEGRRPRRAATKKSVGGGGGESEEEEEEEDSWDEEEGGGGERGGGGEGRGEAGGGEEGKGLAGEGAFEEAGGIDGCI